MQNESTPVTVTSFSQPHVLQTRMKEEKLSHGGIVKANLSPVRMDMTHGAAVLYFCPMQTIEVLYILKQRAAYEIPAQVKVEGISIPADCQSGFYDLNNVELSSNGTIQVRVTEKTTWKYHEKAFPL